eukprot:COSAG04_NODE_25648_length_305_cov_0.504854_1_plen_67_part_01
MHVDSDGATSQDAWQGIKSPSDVTGRGRTGTQEPAHKKSSSSTHLHAALACVAQVIAQLLHSDVRPS